MLKELQNISKHLVVYGLGGLLTRTVGLLLLPFYTHYITPAEYGVMALVDLAGYVIGILVTMEVSSAFMKYYYDAGTEDKKNQLLATTYLLVFSSGLVFLGAMLFFAEDLCVIIVGDKKYTILIKLMFINLFFNSLYSVFQSYIRALEKSKLFIMFQLSKTFLSLVLNIYFIAFLRMGILGIFLSNAIVAILFAVPCSVLMLMRTGLKTSTYFLKELVVFGLPLIPTGVFELVFHYSDRFFLKAYTSMEVVGVYSVAGRFSMILGVIIIFPFRLMWSAKLFELSRKENGKDVQRKVLTYLFLVLLFFFLCIAVPIKEFIQILLSNEYLEAYRVIPLVLLGSVFYGTNWVFKGGLMIRKKTSLICLVTGITAAANLLLNWVLVRRYGAMGAATAIMLSYFLYSAIMFAVSYRHYPLPYEIGRIVKLFTAAAIIFVGSIFLPEVSLLLSLAMKTLLVLFYPVLLYIMNFYDSKEKNVIYKTICEARS